MSDTRPRVICDVVSTSLAVVRLDRELPMPSRAHDGDAGVDLFSALDAELFLRDTLPHPDLSPFIGNGARGITMTERGDERRVRIPGDIDGERAAEIEEAIWDRLHFATHLRSQRLGEYTIGMDLHRSESLALVQLLILYHVVTARAAIALGGTGTRADNVGVAHRVGATAPQA